MFTTLLFDGLRFSAAVAFVMAILSVIGGNVYDISEVKRKRLESHHPHALKHRLRSKISVIIYVRKNAEGLSGSLKALAASNYKNFEVLIIDNGSHGSIRSVINGFIAINPKVSIRLYAKRRPTSRLDAIALGIKQYALKGDLVLTLNAGDQVSKQALKRAVKHFNINPKMSALIPKINVAESYSIAGLIQTYQKLLSDRADKLNSAFNVYYDYGESAVYRTEIFNRLLKLGVKNHAYIMPALAVSNKNDRGVYASDVTINTPALLSIEDLITKRYRQQYGRLQALIAGKHKFFTFSQDYTKSLTWFRLPYALAVGISSLFVPVILTYFIYMAASLHEPTFLIVTWAILSVLVVFSIWGEEKLTIRRKLALTLGMPVTYGVFFILCFVEYVVVLLSIPLPKKTWHKIVLRFKILKAQYQALARQAMSDWPVV
jgi:cellulose synthase/poly-beta-1,6-N-acetylglucosamine synthase-like glycosyltransferase